MKQLINNALSAANSMKALKEAIDLDIDKSKQSIARVSADTKRGRSFTSAKGSSFSNDSRISPEIKAWNKEIDRKKREKRDRKLAHV